MKKVDPRSERASRRRFLGQAATAAAISTCPSLLLGESVPPVQQRRTRLSRLEDHYATGKNHAVTSTSKEASEAAMWMLEQGGNAADAYMTAALAQTVVEHGLTSIGGAFSINYFDASTGKLSSVVGMLGAAENEPYDFERTSSITQTGRAMPVPGFLAGLEKAHKEYGKSEWRKLFEPAIRFANEGVPIGPTVVQAAGNIATRFENGKALWNKEGRMLRPGEQLVQLELGKTLQSVATDGAAAFYEGEFAQHYVERAKIDNGVITLQDMARWREMSRTKEGKLEGSYRGFQIAGAGLLTYAFHLNEALKLNGFGLAKMRPETVFRQYRIMEEVFLATREYSETTHEEFVSQEYARRRADTVLNSPLRKLTFDDIFNTCFLVVRDQAGNIAWGTHSINTPAAFGAGILVDGVYAAHAMNRKHVNGSGGSAPGISTSYALFKNGKPRLIAGSPGFGFVHGPWQYGSGIVEFNLSPIAAMNQPRFGLPRRDGNYYFESHYDQSVFEMLADKKIPNYRGRPSPFTGLVGAMSIDVDGTIHVMQDGRRDGYARAN